MALKTYKLGDYIRRSTEKNKDLRYGIDLITGVSNDGVFTKPKGNPLDVDLKPYKIVNNGAFVYNPTRLDLGSIAYRTEGMCIVSHLYQVFYLNEEGTKYIDPKYLFMYFRRREFCREVTFRNFGSQRPEFSIKDMADIYVPLPDLPTQQKYVDIYESMVANQKSYEKGLDDLKLTCDAFLDKLKKECPKKEIGKLLTEVDRRNLDGQITSVKGINIEKKFIDSVADTNGVDLKKYKLVLKKELAYSGMQTGRDKCVRIALQDANKPIIISPAYSVFQVDESKILPEYLMIWFSRTEIDRLGWFYSDASIRANLDNDRLFEMQIPIPDISVQRSIADIYKVYTERKRINEQLKQQIKDICPILIKGSLEE